MGSSYIDMTASNTEVAVGTFSNYNNNLPPLSPPLSLPHNHLDLSFLRLFISNTAVRWEFVDRIISVARAYLA